MKIKELIEKLNILNEDLEVFIEGCDCVNLASDVELGEHYVCITADLSAGAKSILDFEKEIKK